LQLPGGEGEQVGADRRGLREAQQVSCGACIAVARDERAVAEPSQAAGMPSETVNRALRFGCSNTGKAVEARSGTNSAYRNSSLRLSAASVLVNSTESVCRPLGTAGITTWSGTSVGMTVSPSTVTTPTCAAGARKSRTTSSPSARQSKLASTRPRTAESRAAGSSKCTVYRSSFTDAARASASVSATPGAGSDIGEVRPQAATTRTAASKPRKRVGANGVGIAVNLRSPCAHHQRAADW